jgi:hypothetical protein
MDPTCILQVGSLIQLVELTCGFFSATYLYSSQSYLRNVLIEVLSLVD